MSKQDFNRDDNELFICDTCGEKFKWDDDCAEFDGDFLDLELECLKCRENKDKKWHEKQE